MNKKKILKEINGPQSDVLFIKEEDNYYVEKVSTKRGEMELLDQISFYTNLKADLREYFPSILNYEVKERPYSMRLEMCTWPTLKHYLLYEEVNENVVVQLIDMLLELHINMHHKIIKKPNDDYVKKLYIDRCERRVTEAIEMLNESSEWLMKDFYFQNKLIENPISKTIKILRNIESDLLPEYVCSTHGQLGPSHIFLNNNNRKNFKLIDPKGFKILHDPIIDLSKIGKALLYGTEWLEDNLFSIDYEIKSNTLFIDSLFLFNYHKEKMANTYREILSGVIGSYNSNNFNLRLNSMICSDIIGSLPFSIKYGGVKRVAALLLMASFAVEELENVINNYSQLSFI